jgi:outer membrane protein TolC
MGGFSAGTDLDDPPAEAWLRRLDDETETESPRGAGAYVVRGMHIASFGLVAALLGARADAAEPIRLTLRDAVQRALSEGTAARIAEERVGQAGSRALEARSALLPRLTGETEIANESLNLAAFGLPVAPGQSPVVGPFDLFDFHVIAAMRVVDISARRRYAAAKEGIAVGENDQRRTENDVAAAVASLYVSLQSATATVESAQANVELFTRLRDVAEDQRKSGVATKLDSTRAEVTLARQQQALLFARNARDAARLALLHAIGADQTSEVFVDAPGPSDQPVPDPEAELAEARANRPELASLAAEERGEELTIAAERAGRLPTLSAQFQGGYNGNHLDDLAWTRQIVGLVSVPVFTGGEISARVAEAESRRRELALQRVELERQVEEEVRRAILSYGSALERVVVSIEGERLANEELTLARDRFEAGVASSIEVDNAQTSLVASQVNRIGAAADRDRARYEMWRATGRIRELVGEPQR